MLSQELEIKLDLTSEDNYNKLLEHFNAHNKGIIQTNYFFDTDTNQLSGNGWALRLRIRGNEAMLTAKGPATHQSGGLTVRPEIETEISISIARDMIKQGIGPDMLPPEIIQLINEYLETSDLKLIISFETNRTKEKLQLNSDSIQLEIDKTVYPNGSKDYELEVELQKISDFERTKKRLEALLKELNIPIRQQKSGKLARALKIMGYNMPINE